MRSFELESFRVHLKTFAAGHRCRWEDRVDGRLCVFLEGSMLEQGSQRDVHYGVSDVVYQPPENRPRLQCGESGARTVTIELTDSGLETLSSGGFAIERPFQVRSLHCFAVAERVRSELAQSDEMTPLVLEGLVLDLFGESHRLQAARRLSRPPAWLGRIKERMDSEFDRPGSLGHYAREAGVHPTRLAGRFREFYRTTVGDYIRGLRLRRAMEELRETDKPVGQIAIEVGFSDQSHLTRIFRRNLGTTPRAYRRAWRV